MADCGTLIWVTAGMAALVAAAAWIVGRLVARMGTPSAWPILGAIVVSLAVLQLGARLAVIVEELYTRAGQDLSAVCGGNLSGHAFSATLLVIAAYVGAFFLSFRRARKGA